MTWRTKFILKGAAVTSIIMFLILPSLFIFRSSSQASSQAKMSHASEKRKDGGEEEHLCTCGIYQDNPSNT